jgi:hypothetical protein
MLKFRKNGAAWIIPGERDEEGGGERGERKWI